MKTIAHKIIISSFCIIFLLGVTASGNSDVMCIGENDHIELESICIPCCTESNDKCQTVITDTEHEEHAECFNCSDVDIDSPYWSKRTQKIEAQLSVIKINQLLLNITLSISVNNLIYNIISNSNVLSNQSPPLVALSTVIFLC